MANGDVALKILLIEDKDTCARTMTRIAHDHGLEIIHKRSLQEAKELFDTEEAKKISGVILDIKGSINKGDIPEQSFLSEALKYFSRKMPEAFPLMALTGETDIDEIKRNHKDLKVYEKTKDEEALCIQLRAMSLQYANARIKLAHKKAFDILQKYFPKDANGRLECCLLKTEQLSSQQMIEDKEMKELIDAVAVDIRQLIELLYIALNNEIGDKIVPRDLIKKENTNDADFEIRHSKILWHLQGQFSKKDNETKGSCKGEIFVKRDSYEDSLFNFVYKGCSNILHYTNEDSGKNYSKYIVPALVSAFIEMLFWFKREAEKRGK